MTIIRDIKPELVAGAKTLIVSDFPDQESKLLGAPLRGPAGRELDRMLAQVGLTHVSKTCVLHQHPEGNNIEKFCGAKATAIPHFPPITLGKYLRSEFQPELDRLEREIIEANPNLIIALGSLALAALTGQNKIGKFRGTIMQSHSGPKVIGTYHPGAVLRQWSQRVIVVADLRKAVKEQEFKEIRIPQRFVLIDPTIEELDLAYKNHLASAKELSVDIETRAGHIRCIGFSPTPSLAVVIPFFDTRFPGNCYWQNPSHMIRAMTMVKKLLDSPAEKVMQNGSYDLQWTWRKWGRPMNNFNIDTTLAHHSLYPEMQKDLGFLGSVYTTEPSWKLMRQRSNEVKKEE